MTIPGELDVLKVVSQRLEAAGIEFEFARRRQVDLGGVPLWIASREDLILSKLLWGQESGSELQKRDARSLIDGSVDRAYLQSWADRLGVENELREIMR